MADENNVYVGRVGKVWITHHDQIVDGVKVKERFVHSQSKWANPYTVKEHGLNKSLELYEERLYSNPEMLADLDELIGKKLGCFCAQDGRCHAKVLAEAVNKGVGPRVGVQVEVKTDCGSVPDSIKKKMKEPDVVASHAANQAAGRPGKIRLGQIWRAQKKEDIPYQDGYIPIRVSKGQGAIGNALSPFNLDVPDDMLTWATEDGTRNSPQLPLPQKLELVWQSSKVYQDETIPEFLKRRKKIYDKGEPKRSYRAKVDGVRPPVEGAVLGYISEPLLAWGPSRVYYAKAYERAVQDTESFLLLERLVACGYNLLLLGPDGWPVEGDDYKAAYEDVTSGQQFGHERVLGAMLYGGPKPWASSQPGL
jgi:hypothetical protein